MLSFIFGVCAAIVALAGAAVLVVGRLGGRLANPSRALLVIGLVGGAAVVVCAIILVTTV